MSAGFHKGNRSVIVSNKRFESLINFAIQVGTELASQPDERKCISILQQFYSQAYLGKDLQIEEEFPSTSQQSFMARTFHLLSIKISSNSICNEEPPNDWRPSASKEAAEIANLFSTCSDA